MVSDIFLVYTIQNFVGGLPKILNKLALGLIGVLKRMGQSTVKSSNENSKAESVSWWRNCQQFTLKDVMVMKNHRARLACSI